MLFESALLTSCPYFSDDTPCSFGSLPHDHEVVLLDECGLRHLDQHNAVDQVARTSNSREVQPDLAGIAWVQRQLAGPVPRPRETL